MTHTGMKMKYLKIIVNLVGRPRGGRPQHRCQNKGLCYVCYQQSRALPQLSDPHRVKQEEKQNDAKHMKEALKLAAKAAKVEKILEEDHRNELKRTAEFNWNAHQQQQALQTLHAQRRTEVKEGTDLLYRRPSTNRKKNREVNSLVANEVQSQRDFAEKHRKRVQDMERELEAHVLAVVKQPVL